MPFYLQRSLIDLAYQELERRKRRTHKQYTYADLFLICEDILQFSERKNRFIKQNRITFQDNVSIISDDFESIM